MRLSIHPLVFFVGSLLLCAVWLALRPAPPVRPPIATLPPRVAAPARPKPTTVELAPEILKRYTGPYRVDASTNVLLELNDGRLFAKVLGTDQRYELLATSDTTFYVPDADSDVEFTVDGTGRSQSFVVRFATGTITAQRLR